MMIRKINHYLDNLGEVFTGATIIQEEHRDWVLSAFRPDVILFVHGRWEAYKETNPDWEEKPFVLVPDIAIEVVSKNDSYTDINEKVDVYLELGVKEIWIIDPHSKSALVHTADKIQKLSKSESIKGTVLPDFELKLSELFEKK